MRFGGSLYAKNAKALKDQVLVDEGIIQAAVKVYINLCIFIRILVKIFKVYILFLVP